VSVPSFIYHQTRPGLVARRARGSASEVPVMTKRDERVRGQSWKGSGLGER
jgi:hypothetical protein